ncbi:MAG: adenylyl-sulfate kinase, partial [Terriglobales bacterium]
IFVFCPFEECQRRDPKGLYSKASSGQVRAVTGFDSPYQAPSKPALRLDSSKLSVEQEVAAVFDLLIKNGVLPQKQYATSPAAPVAVAHPTTTSSHSG